MDLLMVLIAIIGISVSIANKKKTAEAQRKRSAIPENGEAAPGSGPVRSPQSRPASSKASTTTKSTTLSKTPSAPGTSKWPWPERNTAQPQKKAAAASYSGTPRYTHAVTSTLEGGHTHTESSMTGEEECPPPKAAANKHVSEEAPTANSAAGGLLSFTANGVLQGVLYAEILGKPKALQRK